MPSIVLRPILLATLVAGTLDILAAIGLTLFYARRHRRRHAARRRLRPVPGGDRLGRPAARRSASPSISR